MKIDTITYQLGHTLSQRAMLATKTVGSEQSGAAKSCDASAGLVAKAGQAGSDGKLVQYETHMVLFQPSISHKDWQRLRIARVEL